MAKNICPKCDTENLEGALVCSKCYSRLKPIWDDKQPRSELRKKICPSCAKECADDSLVCTNCYTDLTRVVAKMPFGELKAPELKAPDAESENLASSPSNTFDFACSTRDFRVEISKEHILDMGNKILHSDFINDKQEFVDIISNTPFFYKEEDFAVKACASSINGEIKVSYFEGMNLLCISTAAAFLKYNPNLVLEDTASMKQFFSYMRNECFCIKGDNLCFTLEALKKLNDKFNILEADLEALENIKLLSGALAAFIIAHEYGHVVNGHLTSYIDPAADSQNNYRRAKEYMADQFAINVIKGLVDKSYTNLFVLGAALTSLSFIALGDSKRNENIDKSIYTHPDAYNRFKAIISQNQKEADEFGLSLENFENCIPR